MLDWAGIIADENRMQLIYNKTGTLIAMTQILLPFMVLPLYSVMKTISPSFLTGSLGYSVSFVVPNSGSYKDQLKVYEEIKSVCIKKNIVASFASEVGEDLDEKNIINYVNNKQPVLFLCFKRSEENLIEYFKGTFSESEVGKKLSEELGKKLGVKVVGRASDLLKNTKSVSITINGNFYQIEKIAELLNFLFELLNKRFQN